MGIVVNPDGAKMQMEGAITMGLGYAFSEELASPAGRSSTATSTPTIPRFSWVPHIEAVLVPNDELAPQGGGEPAITRRRGDRQRGFRRDRRAHFALPMIRAHS